MNIVYPGAVAIFIPHRRHSWYLNFKGMEMQAKGPNHYHLLNVNRNSSPLDIKFVPWVPLRFMIREDKVLSNLLPGGLWRCLICRFRMCLQRQQQRLLAWYGDILASFQ